MPRSRSFAGPEAVLAYLSRYTHRVAISNRRLAHAGSNHVALRYKDYRAGHRDRWNTMTLTAHEFIRRFMLHVLPKGFHRIRHYGLFANGSRAANIERARRLLQVPDRRRLAQMTRRRPSSMNSRYSIYPAPRAAAE